ncbi:MAG: M56 family metallopeptidase [Ferruginibacter sp.]
MSHFAYSFCVTLFHSLWQAALLLLFYVLSSKMFLSKVSAAEKRNFLFSMIIAQLVLSGVTFFIYFLRPEQFASVAVNRFINEYLPAQNLQPFTIPAFVTYLLLLLHRIFKAFAGWQKFNRIYKSGLQKPGLDLRLFTTSTAHRFSIKKPVQLFLSSTIQTPVTFGFLKPVILLPVALVNQISVEQAETLIIHELTHIKANDFLYNWILVFSETFFFFNPFIISICKKIKLEREKNCDTSVIHFKYSAALYAQTLLQAEKIKQAIPVFQLAAVSSRYELLKRIQFFSSADAGNRKNKTLLLPSFILLALLFFSCYSVLQFQSPREKNIQIITVDPAVDKTNELAVSFVNRNLPAILPGTANRNSAKIVMDKKPVKNTAQVSATVNDDATSKDNELTAAGFSENMFSKQVILQEETSGTKSTSLKVYNLVFENGEWILKPDWMATSHIVSLDSLIKLGDSSGVKLLSDQQ